MWHPRLVYTVLRDAIDIENLMCTCPAWGTARQPSISLCKKNSFLNLIFLSVFFTVENHLFWQQACAVIDPLGKLNHLAFNQSSNPTAASTALPFTPYRHFRHITSTSCYVCRINDPARIAGLGFGIAGLGVAKRPIPNPYLHTVFVCKDHRKDSFCGLCLREAPPLENDTDYHAVLCVENDDVDTWPGIHTTCRSCREEWLWRRVAGNPKEREAVGGHKWDSPDWETRQTVESFIEIGEGSIQDVINLANDKLWLRKHTKLPDMLEQAMAATRYTNREEGGYTSDDELLSDVEDEDDPELMSLTEDAGGIKDLALNDWARNRLLDGYWTSPADQWYGHSVHGLPTAVKAIHPTPWNRDAVYEGAMEEGVTGEMVEHPRPATVNADVPPSYQLCEQAFHAFQKQMRTILLPAMTNIVRRLVIESQADGVDPAIRATRMDVEDVARELQDEASWYNGIDWLERKANGERERQRLAAKEAKDKDKEKEKDEDDESSSSSKSSGSHTTSPVLSTTTLQTSPSPPASVDGRDAKKDEDPTTAIRQGGAPSVIIPISPVLESPVLLHPIPYVPVTVSHMPQYSLDAFKMVRHFSSFFLYYVVLTFVSSSQVWREACAPLYHCRCSICERAMISANIAAGTFVLPTQHQQVTIQSTPQVVPTAPPAPLVEIKLDEAPEPRVVVEAVPEEEEEEESVEEEDEEEETGPELAEEEEEDWELCNVNPRKRSSHDIDEDEDEAADGDVHDETERLVRNRRSGSLSKRLRLEGDYIKDVPAASPTRIKKRPSEELDDDDEEENGVLTLKLGGRDTASPKKKSRLDSTPSESPPVSIIGTSIGESDSIPMTGDDEDSLDLSSTTSSPLGAGGKSSTTMLYAQHPRGLTTTSTPISMNEAEMAKLYSFDSASGVTASLDGSEVDA
jgi:hypothetical protein